MGTNYLPPAGIIEVVSGDTKVIKCSLPTTARSFVSGSPMWNNGSGGVEPALQQAGDSGSMKGAEATFASLFVGFAANKRVSQSDFSVNDASQPFLTVHTSGVAVAPCDAITPSAVEIGDLVGLDGFQNEGGTGYVAPDGTTKTDTSYYLYNNKVKVVAAAEDAIGTVCERAAVGATTLKFTFKSAVVD